MYRLTETFLVLCAGLGRIPAILLALLAGIFIAYALIVPVVRYQWEHKKKIFFMQVQHDNEILKVRLETQEQTFQNISAEVHDNIGQQLSLAHFHSERITEAGTDASHITLILRNAIADLRDLSHSLSSENIAELGLPALIKKDLVQLNKGNRIATEYIEQGAPLSLTIDDATLLYRVFQEAIQNVLKHANATKLKVFFIHEAHELKIIVEDNGSGFKQEHGSGYGIENIRLRLKLLRGGLSIDSNEQGSRLLIKIPLNNDS